ncbi:hypothetical protein CYANOKiyG1_44820 [Okeania sp. KiyG1]|nr:hypothetical protein CYANOKiyG1_44820 [Okeania sp. KiyG1]
MKVKDQVPRGAKVVCVLTGHGLKDPDVAIKHSNNLFRQGIEPNIEAVAEVMGF